VDHIAADFTWVDMVTACLCFQRSLSVCYTQDSAKQAKQVLSTACSAPHAPVPCRQPSLDAAEHSSGRCGRYNSRWWH